MRSVATRFLTRLGYRVTGAADGDEALRLIGKDPAGVDLLLTDVAMPGPSGLELARAAIDLRQDLPVVLISGQVDDELRRRAEDVGCVGVIPKPFELQDISAAVRDAVEGSDEPEESIP